MNPNPSTKTVKSPPFLHSKANPRLINRPAVITISPIPVVESPLTDVTSSPPPLIYLRVRPTASCS